MTVRRQLCQVQCHRRRDLCREVRREVRQPGREVERPALQPLKDRQGWQHYRTVQHEVVEVLTEEQHKSRLSYYIEYINTVVGVSNVRRNILL